MYYGKEDYCLLIKLLYDMNRFCCFLLEISGLKFYDILILLMILFNIDMFSYKNNDFVLLVMNKMNNDII